MTNTETYSISLYNRDYSTANSGGSSRTIAYMGQYGSGYIFTGIMYIPDLLKIKWSEKVITSISLRLKHGGSGSYTKKTFFFWSSKIQDGEISERKGSDFVDEFLGEIEVNIEELASGITLGNPSGNLENNFITFLLSNSSYSFLFENLVKYLRTNTSTTICLYNDETTQSGKDYSTNYLNVIEAEIIITYFEGTVRYGINNEWKQCLVYYGNNGQWQQVLPYYGKDNKWNLLGG